MTRKVEVDCEWDLGCGYTSVWDDLSSAQEYFKQAFEESQEKTEMSYEDALEQDLLTFKEENVQDNNNI